MTPLSATTLIFSYFRADDSNIKSRSRKSDFVQAKQVTMYILNKYKVLPTLETIGDMFGNTHASVLNYIRTVNNRMETEKPFRETIKELELILKMPSPKENAKVMYEYHLEMAGKYKLIIESR